MKFVELLRIKRPLLLWGFVLTLIGAQSQLASAEAAEGKELFESGKCGACHQISGPVDAEPVAQRAKIKGPPLWFAGSKFQQEWLIAWLESPTPIRRVKYGSLTQGSNEHPALSASAAQEVGAYLMSLTDPESKSGTVTVKKLSRRKMFKGEKLFAKKQVCFGCHQYPSRQGEIGGFTGPSLLGAGKRLQGDWIYAFMKDPSRYYPNGRMPVYGDQAFAPYDKKELDLLIQYIGNM